MKRKKIAALVSMSAAVGALGWAGMPAHAFVPACTEEIAANYPPILRADLSVCTAQLEPKPAPNVELSAFVERLDGTWVLQSRTLQGITQDGHSRYHIEIDELTEGGATGSAALLECTDESCQQSRVSGAWSLNLGATTDRIALSTRGKIAIPENSSEVKVAMEESTLSRFFQQDGVYVALNEDVGPQLADKRRWDRVVLTERTLTYISCREGRVDRFVKASSSSLVDGTKVREMLKRAVVGRVLDLDRRMP